jgi:hypothetical protein
MQVLEGRGRTGHAYADDGYRLSAWSCLWCGHTRDLVSFQSVDVEMAGLEVVAEKV